VGFDGEIDLFCGRMVINARQIGMHCLAMWRQPKPFRLERLRGSLHPMRMVLSLPMHVNPFSPLKHLSPSFWFRD
jgi:hypothetical protein